MILDQITLGRRLREARENCRLTQEAAAEAVGLSRTALVHIESGKRSLSTLELSQLAKLYHRSVAEFFSDDAALSGKEEDALIAIPRLTKELVGDEAFQREVLRCVEICRVGVELEKLLGRRHPITPPFYQPPAPRRPFEANEQGEWVADEERRRLGLGYAPIADMADLINTQGIWASGVLKLPQDISGMFISHSSIRMAILVNYTHSKERKRFSYAHEYAHAILDRNNRAIVSRKANAPELAERRANSFAAAFLMPSAGIEWFLGLLEKGEPSRRYRTTYDVAGDQQMEAQERQAPGSQEISYRDVATLAHHFRVSYQAAIYRLCDLGHIRQADKTELLERSDLGLRYMSVLYREDIFERNPERKKRKPDRELVSQVVRLAIEAYRREEVSQGWLRDLSDKLEVPADDLVELAEATVAV
jgi:Zn-dependent peptidase ImmA (M78 family)/transcriptional regulator with XRE-family HTH domain